ncbi:hypothetical protein [Streptomyces griseorubiginosus]|uniref:hypothetical protein n=1 Tax=Streptomyces griseorubiginosus TaxID=67304 RepID=UPI0036E72A63
MSKPNPSGPMHGATFNPFGPFVILAATVAVEGEEITVQQQIDRAAWRIIDGDPQLRPDHQQELRHGLAGALVDRLAPAITVHEPARPGKAVSDTSAHTHAAMRDEPEFCQSLELGSEA